MKKLKTESPESFQELSALLQEKHRREQNNPARHFIPNGKQEEFIKMFGNDTYFVSMFCAANGVGKSGCGANILTNVVFGPQNEYFDHPLFKNWQYEKRGRIISDPTTIKAKIIPELEKWFPANEVKSFPEANYEMGKEGKAYICRIETNTGWSIDVMSTEQDAKEFESTDLGFVWIDEPMPKAKFMATLARGRLGMVVIWTYTPLFHAGWIKDWMDEHLGDGYVGVIEAEMEDNCSTHGVRGILKHQDIKRIAESYPEDEKEARVFGKFGHLIGRVHKKFRRNIHIIEPFPIDEKRFTTYVALDPHPRVADHVLYMSVDKNGTKYITAELLSEGLVKELYERMKALEIKMHFRMQDRIIDPAAFVDDQHREEKTVGSQLYDLGMHFIKGSKDLMAGIKRTNDALNYTEREGMMVVPPELYIFNTCPVTIKQLDEYVWSEWKGSSRDEKQPLGRPKDVNDHNVENLHRLLLHEPQHIPYVSSRKGNIDYSSEMDDLDPYAK